MAHHPLDPFGWAPGRAALFLDFDGVIADITHNADDAVPRAGLPELLVDLEARLGRVSIVSGRPVGFISGFIPDVIDIVGLYGLEWRTKGVHHTFHEAEEWRGTMRELAAEATAAFGADVVESKGLSLTVHYRSEPALAGAIGAWAREAARINRLEARPAKLSFEVHPPIRRDKGTAVVELAQDFDPVAYIGDDLGDLPAFDGLDQLARRGVATVRIGVASEEAPPILLSRADHVVDGPAGAEALIRDLMMRVESAPG